MQQENRQKEETKAIPTVSRVLKNGAIIELVYDGAATRLCIYQDGAVSFEDHIDTGTELLVPIPANNNLLKHGAVLLPSGPVDYGSEAELIAEIRDYLYRYVDLSPAFVNVACAYVLFTWVYDAFPELPYLRFIGDFGSGKSRALWVVGSICNKAFFASAASTISPVFYTLDLFRGTLILDEADFRYSDLQSDVIKILNNGSMRGFPILRQTQDTLKQFNPRAFNVFGPKLLAMRKNVQDIALESRFLTEDMGVRPLRSDVPMNLPEAQALESLTLRNKLLMYRFKVLPATSLNVDLVDRSRSGRFNQMIVPLLSVAHDVEMREGIKDFAESNDHRMQGLRSLSIEAELLETLCSQIALNVGAVHLTVGEIAASLKQRVSGDFERPITSRYVGQLLRGELGLFTYKKSGVYVVPASEYSKIVQIALRYGIV